MDTFNHTIYSNHILTVFQSMATISYWCQTKSVTYKIVFVFIKIRNLSKGISQVIIIIIKQYL